MEPLRIFPETQFEEHLLKKNVSKKERNNNWKCWIDLAGSPRPDRQLVLLPRARSHCCLQLLQSEARWGEVAAQLPAGRGRRDGLRLAARAGEAAWGAGRDLPLGRLHCALQLLSLVPLQTGLGEPERCNFTPTASRVSSRSASLQWRTLGSPCNFSLIYNSDTSNVTFCHPVRLDTTTYGCNPKDLQAGTIYHFKIVSLDGEERTLDLQTGKG